MILAGEFHPLYERGSRVQSATIRKVTRRRSDVEVAEDQMFGLVVQRTQTLLPAAHRALMNWGQWSREVGRLTPTLDPPPIFKEYSCRDYTDDETALGENEVYGDCTERVTTDVPFGQLVDVVLHQPMVPRVWRDVARCVYYQRIAAHHYQSATGLRREIFVMSLDLLLMHVQTHCVRDG